MSKLNHNHNAAASDAHKLVRVAVGPLVVCCALMGAMAPAAAQRPGEPQRKEQPRENAGNAPVVVPQRPDPRSFEARAEEIRRIQQDSTNAAESTRRIDRMTPDELRDLRRQINKAGQEVYAIPPRR